jgi:hypothetical protein
MGTKGNKSVKILQQAAQRLNEAAETIERLLYPKASPALIPVETNKRYTFEK